jgi:hypothetical protein
MSWSRLAGGFSVSNKRMAVACGSVAVSPDRLSSADQQPSSRTPPRARPAVSLAAHLPAKPASQQHPTVRVTSAGSIVGCQIRKLIRYWHDVVRSGPRANSTTAAGTGPWIHRHIGYAKVLQPDSQRDEIPRKRAKHLRPWLTAAYTPSGGRRTELRTSCERQCRNSGGIPDSTSTVPDGGHSDSRTTFLHVFIRHVTETTVPDSAMGDPALVLRDLFRPLRPSLLSAGLCCCDSLSDSSPFSSALVRTALRPRCRFVSSRRIFRLLATRSLQSAPKTLTRHTTL